MSLHGACNELAVKAQWHMISCPIFPKALFPLHQPVAEEMGKRSTRTRVASPLSTHPATTTNWWLRCVLGKRASAPPFDIFIEGLGPVHGHATQLADLLAYMLLLCGAWLIEFLLCPKWGGCLVVSCLSWAGSPGNRRPKIRCA